jgi:hypothetical protein
MPRAPSAWIAAAGSSDSCSLMSSSVKRWLRNLPVVLLSSIASLAPATPSSAGGISSSEIAILGSARRR